MQVQKVAAVCVCVCVCVCVRARVCVCVPLSEAFPLLRVRRFMAAQTREVARNAVTSPMQSPITILTADMVLHDVDASSKPVSTAGGSSRRTGGR